LTYWNPTAKTLEIKDRFGTTEVNFSPEHTAPAKGVCRWVLEHQTERYVRDINEDPYYIACSDKTRSEFCVPVITAPFKPNFAIMNWESDVLDGFSELDRSLARTLSAMVSQHAKLVVTRSTLRQGLFGDREDAQYFADEVQREFKFIQVQVWLAEHETARLNLSAPSSLARSLRFTDVSLATKVYMEERDYFSSDPHRDLFVRKEMLRDLKVSKQLLGVPLRFSTVTIGALVCELHFERDEYELKKLTVALEEFASRYVSGRFGYTSLKAASALRILRSRIFDGSLYTLETLVGVTMSAIIGVGFDRARVFKAIGDAGFLCIGSSGGPEADNAFCGISVNECDAVKFDGRRVARLFDPSDLGQEFDPHGADLRKPKELPFANVPIWWGPHLIGALGADNVTSRVRITDVQLNYFTLVAELIAPHLAALLGTEFEGDTQTQEPHRYETAAT
jgi:hypothetical protein